MSFYSFNPNDVVEIIGTSGTYPSRDNCYKVRVTHDDGTNTPKVVVLDYVAKAQVDLFFKMKSLLSSKDMSELYPLIEKLYDETYYQAGIDESLSNADESL